jgi:hypothetical protein
MSTMSFGKRERISFVAAGPLKNCMPQIGPAIYAVTYKQDPDRRPKSHTVLYFGETIDLSKQVSTITTDMANWWSEFGTNDAELYIFFHSMPGSSQYERVNMQHQLVLEYDPHANN